jgi:8-oxo-dGTP pyrophosphatase MutT (NUDIX family)
LSQVTIHLSHPLYRHIAINNNAELSRFTPLVIAGKALGFLHPDVAEVLAASSCVTAEDSSLILNGGNFEERTESLKKILGLLLEKKLVSRERFELYAVAENFSDEPLALADRALMPVLGFQANGIHCNGYVRGKSGFKLWIARRSPTSFVEPNKLDHLVAGGQPYGLTLQKNLAKEAKEEANIPEELVKNAVAAGTVRYARTEGVGIRRDRLFLYDLELPADFIPQSNDGESHDFRLLDADEVLQLMKDTDEFKFNVPLVLIDFYIRHGLIQPNEPGYGALIQGLRKEV